MVTRASTFPIRHTNEPGIQTANMCRLEVRRRKKPTVMRSMIRATISMVDAAIAKPKIGRPTKTVVARVVVMAVVAIFARKVSAVTA
jgi:hypothetical protein